ncbi:MAG: FIST N-terminal domain-containing protein [Candidatus Lokiarchaeota archaeon]
MSTNRDGFIAGKHAARQALEDINSNPRLAILAVDSLTRLHFNYSEVLRGVREVLGSHIPLIGSTANGILVNNRFALRSVGVMLLSGDLSIDETYNYGMSRLEYQKIAQEIYNIYNDLEPDPGRFMLMFQDGIKFPPETMNKQESLNSRVVSMFSRLVSRFFKRQLEEFKEEGLGMPSVQELLQELYNLGWNNRIIGNIATNVRDYDSVEFYNDQVAEDNIVGAFISPQRSTKFGFGFKAGAESTGKICYPTKNIGNFLLKVNDEPALIGLCKTAGINIDSLRELKGSGYLNYHTILGTREKSNENEYVHLTATITDPGLDSLINTGFPFDKVPKEIEIFQSNIGILKKTAEESVREAMEGITTPRFLLGFDCAIRLFAYGDNLPKIVKIIDDTIGKDVPRMIIGSGGEIYGTRNMDYYFNSMTFVTLVGGE